jgi:hypothetical protein
VGLDRGSLSLVSTNEELRERKSSGSGLENCKGGALIVCLLIERTIGTDGGPFVTID